MCLIVFSYREHAEFPLIFAGNRDEFYARPAAAAHFWGTEPELLAGRDLQAGGTWLGITIEGLFATVTNYREPIENKSAAPRSRGELVTEYLLKSTSSESHFADLGHRSMDYSGFNLIAGRPEALYYVTNRGGKAYMKESRPSAADERVSARPRASEIEPGLHGLSNEQLDTPWPKVRRARELFRKAVDGGEPVIERLLDLLADSRRASDHEIPSTRMDRDLESRLSSIFISGDMYGTRASTVVLMREDGLVRFAERTYGPGGVETGTKAFEFVANRPNG